jgi:hypothetical protein
MLEKWSGSTWFLAKRLVERSETTKKGCSRGKNTGKREELKCREKEGSKGIHNSEKEKGVWVEDGLNIQDAKEMRRGGLKKLFMVACSPMVARGGFKGVPTVSFLAGSKVEQCGSVAKGIMGPTMGKMEKWIASRMNESITTCLVTVDESNERCRGIDF